MSRKIKYNAVFKNKAVKRVLKGESKRSICRELNIDISLLKDWERYYKQFGIDGLKPNLSNTQYPPEFKLKVIQEIEDKGLSLRQASLKYAIPSCSVVYNWLRKYKQNGITGLYKSKVGRPKKMTPKKTNESLTKEEQLLEENKSLKAELDLLKKLQALALSLIHI